ncbi:MAG: MFS transporter, partial [Steroidobacteraceae bacterium]
DESWVELVVMLVSFGYFVAHTALTPAGRSFFDYRLLRNSSYVSGAVLIFFVGAILFATRALLPTMLQTLFDYPVTLAGLVTAPSGIGTMLAMLVVGRLVGRLDVRLLVAVGFAITALSVWQMTQYNLDITQSAIVWPGIIQGIGVGLVFVPLSAATFATLPPDMRADGTAMYSLARNIGSAVGISLVQVLLVRNTQRVHAGLVANLTAANPDAHHGVAALAFNLAHTHDVALLDSLITRQATMIAYLDDFRFMLVLTLCSLPLLLLLRPAPASAPAAIEPNALE